MTKTIKSIVENMRLETAKLRSRIEGRIRSTPDTEGKRKALALFRKFDRRDLNESS